MRSISRLLLPLAIGGAVLGASPLRGSAEPASEKPAVPAPAPAPQTTPATAKEAAHATPAAPQTKAEGNPAVATPVTSSKPASAPATQTSPTPTQTAAVSTAAKPAATAPPASPAVPSLPPVETKPLKVLPLAGDAPATDAHLAPKTVRDLLNTQETAEEKEFVDLVNQERTRRGLNALTIEPLLIAVARDHSAEMRDKSYFNHTSPTAALKTPMDRYLTAVQARPGYACVGENLYWCSVVDVQRGHKAFMNSPTHRENVLFARFEKIGVGIIKDARGQFWVTEMFLSNTDPQLKSVARSH